jgi:hypothetical protein
MPFWPSNTSNESSFERPYRLAMQHDGNLVAYDTHDRAVWASNIQNKGKPLMTHLSRKKLTFKY